MGARDRDVKSGYNSPPTGGCYFSSGGTNASNWEIRRGMSSCTVSRTRWRLTLKYPCTSRFRMPTISPQGISGCASLPCGLTRDAASPTNFHCLQDRKWCHAAVLKRRESQVGKSANFLAFRGGQQHIEQIGVVMPHRSSRQIGGWPCGVCSLGFVPPRTATGGRSAGAMSESWPAAWPSCNPSRLSRRGFYVPPQWRRPLTRCMCTWSTT